MHKWNQKQNISFYFSFVKFMLRTRKIIRKGSFLTAVSFSLCYLRNWECNCSSSKWLFYFVLFIRCMFIIWYRVIKKKLFCLNFWEFKFFATKYSLKGPLQNVKMIDLNQSKLKANLDYLCNPSWKSYLMIICWGSLCFAEAGFFFF